MKTEQFGQTSQSFQRPSKTWLYFLVPFNILTATSVFLALPCWFMTVTLATWPKAPFPTICLIISCSLGVSQERVYRLREAYSLICSVLSGVASVITCERQFCHPVPCSGFEKVWAIRLQSQRKSCFQFNERWLTTKIAWKLFQIFKQLSYEK